MRFGSVKPCLRKGLREPATLRCVTFLPGAAFIDSEGFVSWMLHRPERLCTWPRYYYDIFVTGNALIENCLWPWKSVASAHELHSQLSVDFSDDLVGSLSVSPIWSPCIDDALCPQLGASFQSHDQTGVDDPFDASSLMQRAERSRSRDASSDGSRDGRENWGEDPEPSSPSSGPLRDGRVGWLIYFMDNSFSHIAVRADHRGIDLQDAADALSLERNRIVDICKIRGLLFGQPPSIPAGILIKDADLMPISPDVPILTDVIIHQPQTSALAPAPQVVRDVVFAPTRMSRDHCLHWMQLDTLCLRITGVCTVFLNNDHWDEND